MSYFPCEILDRKHSRVFDPMCDIPLVRMIAQWGQRGPAPGRLLTRSRPHEGAGGGSHDRGHSGVNGSCHQGGSWALLTGLQSGRPQRSEWESRSGLVPGGGTWGQASREQHQAQLGWKTGPPTAEASTVSSGHCREAIRTLGAALRAQRAPFARQLLGKGT